MVLGQRGMRYINNYRQRCATALPIRLTRKFIHTRQNPRHPWQSWRDRWIKYLRDEGSRHSASDYLEGSEAPRKDCVLVKTKLKTRIEFSEEDMKILLDNGEVIRKIPSENVADAWKTFAHERDVSIRFKKKKIPIGY